MQCCPQQGLGGTDRSALPSPSADEALPGLLLTQQLTLPGGGQKVKVRRRERERWRDVRMTRRKTCITVVTGHMAPEDSQSGEEQEQTSH